MLWLGFFVCAAAALLAQEAQFQVVRQVSASSGYPRGSEFVTEDERSTFTVPKDKELVVFFKWNGPTGKHTLEGFWKKPDGRTAEVSPIELNVPVSPFAAFWRYNLNPQMEPGEWKLEVKIGGQPAGVHKFTIVSEMPVLAASGAAAPAVSTPAPTTKEIYEKATRAVVRIEKLDPQGQRFGSYLGFVYADGLIATAFQAIDGASSLRIIGPSGERQQVTSVRAWSRKNDWVLIPANTTGLSLLPKAASWNVADTAMILDPREGGSLVIGSVNLAGKQTDKELGERILVDVDLPLGTIGGPLLNLSGEVIAVVGGSNYPGWAAQRFPAASERILWIQSFISGPQLLTRVAAVAVRNIPEGAAKLTDNTLAELGQSQALTPIVSRDLDLNDCVLTAIDPTPTAPGKKPKKQGVIERPQATSEFQRGKDLAIVVSWIPRKSRKIMLSSAIYDADNRTVVKQLEAKVSLDANGEQRSQVTYKTDALTPRQYRVDLMVDGAPSCRAFFRVIE